MRTFGEVLKEIRVSAKLTQEDLAKKCGLTKQSISRYEKSDREPNIRTAKTIADALGVPLSALVPNATIADVAKNESKDMQHALLIELFDQLPKDAQQLVIAQLQGIAQSQKALDAR